MLTLRAFSGGAGYSERHLEHGDYYDENGRIAGQFWGRGAEKLGLSGKVDRAAFEALREGYAPDGQKLRQRKSTDKVQKDGKVSEACNLVDMTFSAPKSLSVMAGPGGDGRLLDAHDKAVLEALTETEKMAATRVRSKGRDEDRTTGNLVVALYRHEESRELDPQCHTHAVGFNLTFDDVEGRWKALKARQIFDKRGFITEVYRAALARETRALGYDVEFRYDKQERQLVPELVGVSAGLCDKFSERSKQRDAAIADFVAKNGRQPSKREVAVLVRETRADKLTEISTSEVKRLQLAKLTPEENRLLQELRENAENKLVLESPDDRGFSQECLSFAFKHSLERFSVVEDRKVLETALEHGRGRVDVVGLRRELSALEKSGRVLRAGSELTTPECLRREKEMIATINGGAGKFDRLGGKLPFEPAHHFNPQQKQAVEKILDSQDFVTNFRGAAGVGKTETLREIHHALKLAGREVVALAPSQTAVEELQEKGFRGAMTLQALLLNEKAQGELSGKVVVLDEAGMVSTGQMSKLLNICRSSGARVLLSGDSQQLQSVEAGDALRMLEKESKLRGVTLTEVERQKASPLYKKAVETLRDNPARGFELLERMDAVCEVDAKDKARSVADAYAVALASPNSKGGARSVLVVCPTHAEIREITAAIREDRQKRGELGDNHRTERLEAVDTTLAQRKEAQTYQPGQVLVFHQATKSGIKRHQAFEVARVDDKSGKVIARDQSGTEKALSVKQCAGYFGVFQKQEMQLAAGDKLLLQANRRDAGLHVTNGEIVHVSSVDEKGRVHLKDGRVLPADYRQFAHGYAVTAHKSQGKTVDSVIISGDRMAKELFYVAATRARETVQIFTTDADKLRQTVGVSGKRKAAVELLKDAGEPSLLETLCARGVDACRQTVGLGLRMVRNIGAKMWSLALDKQPQRDSLAARYDPRAAYFLQRGLQANVDR